MLGPRAAGVGEHGLVYNLYKVAHQRAFVFFGVFRSLFPVFFVWWSSTEIEKLFRFDS